MFYTISFGDSDKYRLPIEESDNRDISQVREDVKAYLQKRFPEFSGLHYLEQMNIEKCDNAAASKLPELNDAAIPAIERTLCREAKVGEDQKTLDRDAPWSNVNSSDI